MRLAASTHKRHQPWRLAFRAPAAALAAGAVLTGWLAIQFGVIGIRAPVQWVTLGLLLVLVALALLARHRLAGGGS